MKRGAFDYLNKPLDLKRLQRVVGEAAEVARLQAPVVLAKDPAGAAGHDGALCGTCPSNAGGVQGHRPGGRAGRDCPHHGRERH